MRVKEIKKLRIKKNIIILTVLFSVITIALFYFLVYRYEWIDMNILDGIYLFVLFGVFILLVVFKNKIYYYLYRYNYLLMLEDDLPPLETKKDILSTEWQLNFSNEGFIKHLGTSRYSIYYQIPKKDSPYKSFGKTLLCIVVNNDPKLDLYSKTIQNEIKKIYDKIEKDYPKLKKEVVIQFKEYEKFNDEAKKELQKILSFKQDSFTLVNITVGYFPKTKRVYYLRPKKRYPNKHYYLACKLIEKYI